MKKFFLTWLICFSIPMLAQDNEQVIQTTMEQMFQEVFSNLDKSKVDKYFTPDVMLFENMEIMNYDSILEFIENTKNNFESDENKNHVFKRINQFEFLKTQVKNDHAWISYKNKATFTMDGTQIAELNWLESANLIRTPEGWKIQFLHSTLIK